MWVYEKEEKQPLRNRNKNHAELDLIANENKEER